MTDYVAYEIIPGWQLHPVTISGRQRHIIASRLWRSFQRTRGASFRAVDRNGEEFGTKRPDERHGAGCFTERCSDCGLEFKTPKVGDYLCPGCDLLNGGL